MKFATKLALLLILVNTAVTAAVTYYVYSYTVMYTKAALAPAEDLRNKLIGIMAAALLIAVLVIMSAVRRLTSPLSRLKAAAAQIGAGDLNVAIDIRGKDEIGELAEGFNRMAADLKRTKVALDEYSRTLENLVEKRTSDLNETVSELKDSRDVLLSILEDTDEAKKKLEEALKEINEKEMQLIMAGKLSGIGQMAAGVAHEINNPLTCVLGYTQLMLAREGIDASVKDDLRNIEREARRSVNIIENLLSFARPRPPIQARTDVHDALKATLSIMQYSIEREKVEVIREFGRDIPSVIADSAQLQQVFMNLILNAVNAMPAGGTLTIGTCMVEREKEKKFVCVYIADTGKGIPDEIKDRIFDPFFTTSYENGQKGSGLGLSMSHSIVDAHGGFIEFESEIGKGTTFRVLLPPSDEEARISTTKGRI